ncbi:MAG: type II toxin-antitoxin system RelE/ParE family toxin [Flavobacteriales bacterium]
MAVEYRIIWSEQATIDLREIYDAILLKWSLKEAERLLDLIKEFEAIVCIYPEGFKLSSSIDGVRIGHIHRTTTAIYRIQLNTIEILTLFDNRQDEEFRD